ncbi:MAG: DUF1294 domain-containing protein [Ardenticatenales bacterium]|nr:DUF1294 domain-containing protein [Ardenticatenales bacterium]
MASSVLKGAGSYVYGIVSLLLSGLLTFYFYTTLGWHPYSAWVGAASIAAFFMYGIDKVQTDKKRKRVPNNVLDGLALMGGFLGAWLGMFGFWHQVRRFSAWFILIASLVIHGGILYYFF